MNHILVLFIVHFWVSLSQSDYVTVAPGPCLWPPNHKYYSIENFLSSGTYIYAANSDCPIKEITFSKCTQTETSSSTGADNCNYSSDSDTLCVLAERSGNSPDGRQYVIEIKVKVECEDDEQTVTYTLNVPHDARGGRAKTCEKGSNSKTCGNPSPQPEPAVNNGQVTANQVSQIYSQKKQQIQSNTDDVLILNNVMAGSDPVNVIGLGINTKQTEKTFEYDVVLSNSVDGDILDMIKVAQAQAFGLPEQRFVIAATAKRQSSAIYAVTVNTDGTDLTQGAITGIAVGCVVGVALIFVGIILIRRRASQYNPLQ